MCLYTISPICNYYAIFLLFAFFKRIPPFFFITVFAPGCKSGPLITVFFIYSILYLLTTYGNVRIMAIYLGTISWPINAFGSGEITDLPEKSTLLPDKFPLNLPCLPFNLYHIPVYYHFYNIFLGNPGESELIYLACPYCNKFQSYISFLKH